MTRKAKNKADALLELKGLTWWFQRDVPADCRAVYGKKTWMTNLATSDLRVARQERDKLKAETTEAFKKMRAGVWNPKDALSAPERGQLYRDQIAALVGGLDGTKGLEPVAFQEGDADELDALELVVLAAEAERDSYRGATRAAFEGALRGAVEVDQHLDAYPTGQDRCRSSQGSHPPRFGGTGRTQEEGQGAEGLAVP